MKTIIRYGVVGIALYLVFMIITLPADRAYVFARSHFSLPPVYGIEGTIWSGRAERVVLQDAELDAFSWRFRPLQLLRGRAGYRIAFDSPAGRVAAEISRGTAEALYLADIHGNLEAAALANWLGSGLVEVSGPVEVRMDRLVLSERGIEDASGQVTWTDANVLTPNSVRIGNFSASFATEDDAVKARINDDGQGPVEIDGELVFLEDRTYRFTGRLAGRGSQAAAIEGALRFLGTPRPGGKYDVTYSGRMDWLNGLFPPASRTPPGA